MSSCDLVDVLTPQVEKLFDRHLATTKSWMPHELIPWERAVEAAPRDAVGRGTLAALGRRAQRARRQPADRGQPSLLLRDHQPDVRERRVARVGAALDGGGDAARHRDPRLHHGHARGRSRSARARADASGVRRPGAAARYPRSTRSRTWRCRSWRRASRTATPGTCSTTKPATGSWHASRPTRTCTTSSIATSCRPRSRSIPPERCARSSARCARSRCRARESPTSARTRRRSRRPVSTTSSLHHDQVLVPVVLRHWGIETIEGLSPGGRDRTRPHRAPHRPHRARRPPPRRPARQPGPRGCRVVTRTPSMQG